MDYTAAKRMADFRRRMKEKGFKQKQIWVDDQGFPGKAGSPRSPKIVSLTRDDFLTVLDSLVQGTDESFSHRLYQELSAYARGLRELWNMDKRNPSLFEPEDLSQKG